MFTLIGGSAFAQYFTGEKTRAFLPWSGRNRVIVDWDGDGEYANAYSDVTTLVLDLKSTLGRATPSPLEGRAPPGTMTLVLDNRRGTLSPQAGNVRLVGRALQWQIPFGPRWTGVIASANPDYWGSVPVLILKGETLSYTFANTKLDLPASNGQLTGELLDDVLAALGVAEAQRILDAGQVTLGRVFVGGQDSIQTIRNIEDTELGFCYDDSLGNFIFEDHAHRSQGVYLLSRAIYSDAGPPFGEGVGGGLAQTQFLPYLQISERDAGVYVCNSATIDVTPFSVAGLAVLWTHDPTDVISLGPGETKTLIASFTSEYVNAWTTPTINSSTGDIRQTGVADGDLSVAVVKKAQTMPISITNHHASLSASLTLVQARGTAVIAGNTTKVSAFDQDSADEFGVRDYRTPPPWLPNVSSGQAHVNRVVAANKDNRPFLMLRFLANMTTELYIDLMQRKISDRVTVLANQPRTALSISTDFFVEYIEDHWDVQKNRHEVRLDLSQVGIESAAEAAWILGTSVLDVDTVLGF